MTPSLRRADDRCRHCDCLGIDAHAPWCIHAAQEPLPDDPPEDRSRTDAAEDFYFDERIGEATS